MPREVAAAGYVGTTDKVYVVGGNVDTDAAAVYNIWSNIWEELPKMMTGRKIQPCVFVLGNALYAAGGSADNWASSMEKLNLSDAHSNPVWKTSIALPTAFSHTSCVTLNGWAIVTGGYTGSADLDTAYKWKPGESSWTSLQIMQGGTKWVSSVLNTCFLSMSVLDKVSYPAMVPQTRV